MRREPPFPSLSLPGSMSGASQDNFPAEDVFPKGSKQPVHKRRASFSPISCRKYIWSIFLFFSLTF
jgi:hypothetical protein